MGMSILDTIPAKGIRVRRNKLCVENLVPISSEFEGISNDTCDVPNCDNNYVNVESELVGSLINHDTSIVHSSKIDPILEEFADELSSYAQFHPLIPDQEGFDNIDNSNDPLLELPEFESFHFDPSLPRPLPEPPDVCLDMLYNDESFEPGEGENIVVSNVEEDDSFTLPSVHFYHFSLNPKILLYLAPPGV
ncbi:hypothetical protein Tco_0919934 [Tanacetum coccineum]